MLSPSSGTGTFYKRSAKIIRLARKGCANRPFFHVVVTETRRDQHHPVIEQLGTYDPLANENGERLVSLNFERIRHWMGNNGAVASKPVRQLFGLAGFLPVHPTSYVTAWRNRAADSATAATEGNERLEKVAREGATSD